MKTKSGQMSEIKVKEDAQRRASADFLALFNQKIRFEIVKLLYLNVELSYTEILDALQIDQGLLNFHLRKIKWFIETTDEGTYILSEYGKVAYETLGEMETRTKSLMPSAASFEPAPLHIEGSLVARRVVAFLIDIVIMFVSTGLFFDKNVVEIVTAFFSFRFPNLSLTDLSYSTISGYSSVFFASYIVFALLEAYKGQTLGKFLLGIRVLKINGRKVTLMDSAVRNLGKVFLLPLDIILGLAGYRSKGYLRFFDYYTQSKIERVKVELAYPPTT
ncbi:MAG: RDD family protein [Thaumarchaeota archaeon]|nr:RDD family protein [Nitrososphaerota archaeon]